MGIDCVDCLDLTILFVNGVNQLMYLVTGGAGFIGSHIVKALNDRGDTEITVVDDLSDGQKFVNLSDCTIADYMDKSELAGRIESGNLDRDFKAIFHQGACTNTMEHDGLYMMENNYTFSKLLLHYALENQVPFVYASSGATYGNSSNFEVDPTNERPLNVYGYSKLVFDQHVRWQLARSESTIVGLRYFNVYGPRETQKGKMASMVYRLYCQLRDTGKAKLFKGTDGYDAGEQLRDFVFVEDVVKVNLALAETEPVKGIFNCGTGEARTFNAIANCLIKTLGKGKIDYIDFPKELEGKYQSYTQADITSLRKAGYSKPFTSLEEGITKSVEAWQNR